MAKDKNMKTKDKIFRILDVGSLVFGLLSILFTIAFLGVSLGLGNGNVYINTVSIIISSIYAIFLFILIFAPHGNRVKTVGKKVYKYSRLIVSAVSLGLNIYALIVTKDSPTFIAIFMVIFFSITLYLKILFEIMTILVKIYVGKVMRLTKESAKETAEQAKQTKESLAAKASKTKSVLAQKKQQIQASFKSKNKAKSAAGEQEKDTQDLPQDNVDPALEAVESKEENANE